jgi:hypothetical protein
MRLSWEIGRLALYKTPGYGVRVWLGIVMAKPNATRIDYNSRSTGHGTL